ncbi:SDR family NAD(P)-dependent oxidoreductase [Chloroflexus sp.]|uniref:SDR family NAD(P)-dependent oxidoreductase n=1 Tax=Chloroflexus sp. TaxID=1904827 RepID=UPI00260C7DCF|nr:SDR family oxidoreductase [uncultured Chloroflexus sp.]
MSVTGRLAGKIALITGGSGNIGSEMTRRFLAEGATVIMSGRNSAKLASLADRVQAETGVPAKRIDLEVMDGSDPTAVRAGIDAIISRHGRIDILVNNAGSAGAQRRLAEIPLTAAELGPGAEETLAESVANLLGMGWNLMRLAAPHMPAGSAIINISTIFSRAEYYGRIPYVVPKAALNTLTQIAARELGARGIRVNTIFPGPIESERIHTVFQRMDELKGRPEGDTANLFMATMRLCRPDDHGQLERRFPTVCDVADAAVFLASDESAALTGETIEVTHGMDLPARSETTLLARTDLRTIDAGGRTTLICAGDQIEEVMALTGMLRTCGSEVIIGFRSESALAQFEQAVNESRRLAGETFAPPIALRLDPGDPGTIDAVFDWAGENTGGIHAAVILPAAGRESATQVIEVDDAHITTFLTEEIIGPIVIASRLARYWQSQRLTPGARARGPRVIFLSNGAEAGGNVYGQIQCAAIEQLIRVWRHEAALDYERAASTGERVLPPVWANQIVRFNNRSLDGLEFACAWTAQLLHSQRQIQEITLTVPRDISATTGARSASVGWAESLIGLHLGKVALITGGSAGIGGQIGRLLALSGARVMLAARDYHKLAQIQATIQAELAEVGYTDVEERVQITPNCDVSNEDDLVELVERTLAAFGTVDYLINNAGIAGVEEMVIDMPVEGWRHTLAANLISNYSLMRKLAPLMKKQGSGYVLNVSSYFGGEKDAAIPYPNRSDYAVSKAGQRAMAEVLARFLGPEVQINAIAPGPVEGDRLRGTGERPGLFARRARLILENKRLNELHAALIAAARAGTHSMHELVELLLPNDVAALEQNPQAPEPLRELAKRLRSEGDPAASSSSSLLNRSIAAKLLARLNNGGYELPADIFAQLPAPPDPFFTRSQIDREARKVRDGVMGMLYLQRMPTEFDVAMATVYYLADRNVSGETFHPSGGLRYERTPTGGELFGVATPERLAELVGATVYIIGEHLTEHLNLLARAYLERYGARQVVMIVETEAGAETMRHLLHDHVEAGRLPIIVAGDQIEAAIDRAIASYGRPGPVVCTPFRPLPTVPLVGRKDSDWSTVLSEADFAELCEHQLTHHFRVARKIALSDGATLALVTPETTATSTTEQFALANFVKTTLHAFTATIGVESERTAQRILINQIDLTRRARAEEPRDPRERQQELERFIDAIMLVTAPLPPDADTRYAGRIHRGRAITV